MSELIRSVDLRLAFLCFCVFLVSEVSLFKRHFSVVCVFSLGFCAIDCLAGKTHLRNVLLSVDGDVKLYSVIHSVTHLLTVMCCVVVFLVSLPFIFTTHEYGEVVMFSVASVCLSVCLSVILQLLKS